MQSGQPGSSAQAGERLASQERRLRLLVTHLAGAAVRARVEPDDLVQEVFLRALGDPRGLPPSEPGEGALWRVLAQSARHTVIDVARALRAHKRRGTHEPLARSDWSRAGSGPPAPGMGPATAAVAGETSRALARRFLALPPEYRRVIGLRQFEGLSARAAAARLGRSEAAVHSLYRRALVAWEAALGPELGQESAGSRDESGAAARLDPP